MGGLSGRGKWGVLACRQSLTTACSCYVYQADFPFYSAPKTDQIQCEFEVSNYNECQSQITAWQPSQQDIDEKPWKYTGYQSFSTFIASDNDFLVFRRFGILSARVLLSLQDQLSCVEEDLEICEKRVRGKDVPDIHNGSFRQESQEDRKDLVCRAQRLLREYSQSSPFVINI